MSAARRTRARVGSRGRAASDSAGGRGMAYEAEHTPAPLDSYEQAFWDMAFASCQMRGSQASAAWADEKLRARREHLADPEQVSLAKGNTDV